MGSIRHYEDKLYVISGEDIFVLDMESGKDDHITIPEMKKTETKSATSQEPRNITSLEFSKCGQYTAVATENKWVLVYDKKLELNKKFIINRTASKICFTSKNDILVADKSGDVYLYEANSDNIGTLLLGHRSVILDLILSNCEKYVITCDRDEKIRVSHYPNCYNIVSYCLGHSEFVTKMKLFNDEILVSASGDGTVRFWNFIEGQELNVLDTNEYVDDRELLEKFASKFEKTEISALPVSDMDIYVGKEAYLAVSICGCNLIQLYNIDLENLSCSYLTKFVNEEPFRFCLSNNLYVFSTKIHAISYLNSSYTHLSLNVLENFYEKYHNVMKHCDDNFINLLYKRKYDNVQEYLERKRQRTEIK